MRTSRTLAINSKITMASGFHSHCKKCQDCARNSYSATYFIAEKQDLCKECANKKGHTVQLRLQEEDEWMCRKHGKPIEYYCTTECVALCQACVIISHQKPCAVEHLEDVLRLYRQRVQDSSNMVKERKQKGRQVERRVNDCYELVDAHLESVVAKLDISVEEATKRVSDKESMDAANIRKEAEGEIQKIKKKRDLRLQKIHQDAENDVIRIKAKRQDLDEELQQILSTVRNRIEAVRKHVLTNLSAADYLQIQLEKLFLSKKELVDKTEQLEANINDTCLVDIPGNNTIDRITRVVQKVDFEERAMTGDFGGRIVRSVASWELLESIPIPEDLVKPYFVGCVDDSRMVISDVHNRTLYEATVNSKVIRKVLQGNEERTVVSCISLDEDTILCGNYCKDATGDTMDGVSLYNRQWDLISNIQVAKTSSRGSTFVSVDSDKHGRILAAEACQSDIQIINPTDGEVLETFVVHGKKVQWIRSVSSGDIVVKTGNGEFSVLDMKGVKKASIVNAEWDGCLCGVDSIHDLIYVVYRDVERGMYAVDQVTMDGQITARKIVEYPLSKRKDVVLPCVVTSAGNIVTCNGDNLFIFKAYTLEDLKVK